VVAFRELVDRGDDLPEEAVRIFDMSGSNMAAQFYKINHPLY
jgi:hypothetical protein